MKSWLQLVGNTVKVFIVFMGCTLIFYYGILWVSKEYESYHRYDEPKGRAVKVVQMDEHQPLPEWVERLMFFYHFGE
ncbi:MULTISPECIES: YqzK family protein [Bacillaceae]|uniref:YqzK family protein n=1 Tax=Bacillaceae TaxID=186817 RepID=UPI00047E3065|nr:MULTISPECIES: YqzK family protein [Bacillaceae]UOE96123.1 YqzK family protein [Alkalihalobacillus sp. LMS39]